MSKACSMMLKGIGRNDVGEFAIFSIMSKLCFYNMQWQLKAPYQD